MNDDLIKFPINQKLKRAQSLVGHDSDGLRAEHDFYPTPPEATEALLGVEKFTGKIWECACGDGSMSKVFQKQGFDVLSTELIDRGFGETGHDFLTSSYTCENVVTNPPFTLAEKFVMLALERTTAKVAILGKLQFLEGVKRKMMFEKTPLKNIWVFSKRVSMYRNGDRGDKGTSMIAFAWYVWEHGYEGKPTLGWI